MKTIVTLEDALEVRDCIKGDCAQGHEGICLYDSEENFSLRQERAIKPLQIFALKERMDEAEGFSHGGSEWTSNDTLPTEGEYANYENGDPYLRELFLKQRIAILEKEIEA